MATPKSNYSAQIEKKYDVLTENVLAELPPYCTSYIKKFSDTTQPRTRCGYIQDIRLFFRFLKQNNPMAADMDIKDIPLDMLDHLDQDDIIEYELWLKHYEYNGQAYYNDRQGIKRKLASLRSFYKYLSTEKGMITNNPAVKVNLPKIPDKKYIRVLENGEREDFLELFEKKYADALDRISSTPREKLRSQDRIRPAIIKRDKAIFFMLLGSGMRVSELVGIDLGDIKEETGRVNIIRKGGDHDYLLLSEEVLSVVFEYLNEGYRDAIAGQNCTATALFISAKKTRMSVRSIERMIKSYADEALGQTHGISPHKLRATFGTQYYQETGDIRATADVLGNGVEVARKYYARSSGKSKEYMRNIRVNLDDAH